MKGGARQFQSSMNVGLDRATRSAVAHHERIGYRTWCYFFQVFSTTFEKVHDPVFAKVDFEVDIDGRTPRLNIPGWIEARGEPILNPVTSETHRARINLPNGFEYDICEVGRGWAETQGPLKLSIPNSHAQFARLHLTESRVVH